MFGWITERFHLFLPVSLPYCFFPSPHTPPPSPFLFPLWEGLRRRKKSCLLLPFEFESSKETTSYGGKKPEKQVFLHLISMVKSEGLYVLKKCIKRSNFNTWLTSNVTSYIKRGHLPEGPFLPALPFHCPTPTPRPPHPFGRWTARQSLCLLGFPGAAVYLRTGHAGQCQGLSKEVTELSQEEKKLDELIQSCTWTSELVWGFRESKISFVPPVQWGSSAF